MFPLSRVISSAMLFALMVVFCWPVKILAASVSHVSEGKINGQTSLVVNLDGKTEQAFDLPVSKDDKPLLNAEWQLSSDRTYQYLPIENNGLGEFKISLASVNRIGLEPIESVFIHEMSPSIRVLGKGPFLNASGDRAIPVETVNATGISVSLFKVDNPHELLGSFYYTNRLSTWSAQQLRKNFTHVEELNFATPTARPNESKTINLTLPNHLKNGWYVVAIKPENSFDSPELLQLLLSDLGVQAKRFENHLAFHVVDLNDNSMVENGEIKVYSDEGLKATHPIQNGFAQFEYETPKPNDVFHVISGDKVSVLPAREIPLDLSDFDVAGPSENRVKALIFSNRDLFKPGETIKNNVLLRDSDGDLTEFRSVYAELIKPNGSTSTSQTVRQTLSGFFEVEFLIPPSANLGKWKIRVKANPTASKSFGEFSLNVAEFVPERMALELEVPDSLAAGLSLPIQATGRYLFGKEAGGHRLTIHPSLRYLTSFPTQHSDYFVAESNYFSYEDVPESIDIKLDATGKAQVKLEPISPEELTGPALLTLNSQLFETGGGVTARQHSLLISNNNSVVGLKPLSTHFEYYQNADFDVVLLDSMGENLLSGTVDVRVERNRGGYYWVFNQNSGWELERDDNWRIVEDTSLALTGKSETLSFATEWGQYRIRAISPDGQKTEYYFYVGWQDGDAQVPAKPDQLTVRLNQKSYLPGEVIQLDVESPVSGLLNVELVADKVYSQTSLSVGQTSSVSLPIPDGLKRHDLYVVATLTNTDQSSTRRLLSVTPIRLNRDEREVKVELELPDKLKPLTRQDIVVKTNLPLDHNGYVLLTIADQGILNLSRYAVPNPFEWFYRQKRLNLDILDLYSRQFESRPSSFVKHRYGGDGGLEDNASRDNLVESKTFNQVLAPIQLDEQGNAVVTIDVPDYNGEVKLVATVFDGNRFGYAVGELPVSAPIVAELSIPRFFALENRSQVYVETSNQTEQDQVVALTLSSSRELSLVQPERKTITLEPNETQGFAIDVQVGTQTGMAALSLEIESEPYSATRNWHVPVRSSAPFITKSDSRILQPGDYVKINQATWDGVTAIDEQNSKIMFSHSPLIDTDSYIQGLFHYPYGCVEQTTSKAFPWLQGSLVERAHKDRAHKDRAHKEIAEQIGSMESAIHKAVARLARAQQYAGGFGLWGRESTEDLWLTTYVAEFLLEARNAHANVVPEAMVKSAVNRIKNSLYEHKDLQHKAYAAYVLAKQGLLSYSDAKSYLKAYSPEDSLNNVYLGAAFYLLGDLKTASRYVESALKNIDSNVITNSYYYDSPLSGYAKIINIVTELEKISTLSKELKTLRVKAANHLFTQFNQRRYFSTQERYALAMAGLNLEAINRQQISVLVNDAEQILDSPMSMRLGDVYKNSSSNPVYVTQTINGFADRERIKSTTPFELLNRTWLTKEGEPLAENSISVGDTLIVEVEFKLNEPINRAMLVDFIPSGFVIENPQFSGSQSLLDSHGFASSNAEFVEHRNDRLVVAADFSANQTYRYYYVIRAETPSKSTIPSIYIEDMYNPERFVLSDSADQSIDIVR